MICMGNALARCFSVNKPHERGDAAQLRCLSGFLAARRLGSARGGEFYLREYIEEGERLFLRGEGKSGGIFMWLCLVCE